MGLWVALLGIKSIRDIRQDPNNLPEFSLVLAHCRKCLRDASSLQVNEIPAALEGVRELGPGTHLLMLQGLAILCEASNAIDASANESDLRAASTVFYGAEQVPKSRFAHLVRHHRESGFFVPLDAFPPRLVKGYARNRSKSASTSVGSSYALLRELDELNAVIALPGDPGQLGEEKFARLALAHRWPHVARVWGELRMYARESIAGTAFIQLSTSPVTFGKSLAWQAAAPGASAPSHAHGGTSASAQQRGDDLDDSAAEIEGLDYQVVEIEDARRTLDTESLTQFDMAAVAGDDDWVSKRRPRVATDRALTGKALDWLMALPPTLRPEELGLAFPRIVNALSQVWDDPEQFQVALEGLLFDGREGRQGFPPAVHAELLALHEWTRPF